MLNMSSYKKTDLKHTWHSAPAYCTVVIVTVHLKASHCTVRWRQEGFQQKGSDTV